MNAVIQITMKTTIIVTKNKKTALLLRIMLLMIKMVKFTMAERNA